MTDQGDMTPAVWDPTANGGAGGWVRRPVPGAPRPAAAPPVPPAPPGPPGSAPGRPPGPPPGMPPARPAGPPTAGAPGAVGDQGPPLGARPYLPPGQPPGPPAPAGYGFPPPQGPGAAAPTQSLPPVRAPLAKQPGPFQQPAPGYPPQPAPGYSGPPGYQPAPGYPPQRPQQPGPFQQPPAGYPQPGGGLDLPGRYEEDEYDEDEDRPARRAPLLIGAGLVLLLAVGGGAVVAMQNSGSDKAAGKPAPPAATSPAAQPSASAAAPSGGPASGSPSAPASASASAGAGPNAQNEAKSLDDLLNRGESAKAPIGSAVAKVASCPAKADIDSAAQVFDSGAQQRDQLLADLGQLNLADVPGGADAVQSLKSAWQTSADIDRAYAAWARSVSASGCGGGKTAPSTPDKQKADQLNPQATQAKQDFVAKWNALAGSYGLASRTWDRI
ncbi:hypothetical protein ACFYNO_33810 [Kitasatospora sp. NPDC006697]|uniref:hypothetical protein n=1 Tax=Kitasatospora sp. NPDC006697 TaxID=3364020 RepID=UPI0036CEDAFD